MLERDRYVQVAFWYGLRNWASDADAPLSRYGLMQNDFSPKPAYFAFKRYALAARPRGPIGATRLLGPAYPAASGASRRRG